MRTGILLGILISTGVLLSTVLQAQPTWAPGNTGPIVSRSVPVATFENDIYVAWWTNKTGNDEVMYRVSSDAGKTFTDKINLSNSPNSNSTDVEISADEGKVAITWWEHGHNIDEPVMRVSTDGGKTFGPLLKLATNGTIG
jgi:hypothetical protein